MADESRGGDEASAIVPNVPMRSKALETVLAGIDWAYDKALNGIPGVDSVDDLVAHYLQENGDPEKAIDNLINWQIGKASTAGFVSGLGGIVTLPVAIPLNLASVLFIQLRMIATIAAIRGYNVRSDQVRVLCTACLVGSAATDALKDVGIQVGAKLTQAMITQISGSVLVRINQAVGFRLVTKAGTTGLINLSKLVPFLGGVVGGAIDGLTTNAIGFAAKKLFTDSRLMDDQS